MTLVRFIKTKKNAWAKNIKAYEGTFVKLAPPLDSTGDNIVTGLTVKQEREFEERLGFPTGHLAKSSSYWDSFCLVVDRDEITLDLDKPMDDLYYHFLIALKKVATSMQDLKQKPMAQFVIFNEEDEAVKENKKFKERNTAFRVLEEMSPSDKRMVLSLYDGGYAGSSIKDSTVENKLNKEVELNPAKFLGFVKDPSLVIKSFIFELVNNAIFIKKGTAYYFASTEDLIGYNLDDAVEFINNKANTKLVADLKKQLNSNK